MTDTAPDHDRPEDDQLCLVCGGSGRLSDPVPYEGKHRYRLERGWRKRWLIVELAKGELSQRTLARALGCHLTSIQGFAQRHAEEISEAVQKIEDEFVSLWITEKVNRLAELQQDVEDANEIISEELENRGVPSPDDDEFEGSGTSAAPTWVRLKQAALRAAAEELGQIPNRVRMDLGGGQVVTYRVEGVDMDKL